MKAKRKVKSQRMEYTKHDGKHRQPQRQDAWCVEDGGHFFDLVNATFCRVCSNYICPDHTEEHYHEGVSKDILAQEDVANILRRSK